MNQHIQTATTFIATHRKQFIIGIGATSGVIVLAFFIALFVYNNSSMKYTYQPVKACSLLTPTEAQSLLAGDKVISTDTKAPVVSGDVATSKCSYTDANPDASSMVVIAVAVRSGVNDQGVAKNKTDFATARSNNVTEAVKNLGESAYFNKVNGQLNILDGHRWIILSYVVGSTPETDTTDKVVELAHKVLR